MSLIVAFKNTHRVILATDSLGTSATEDGTTTTVEQQAAGKIATAGPWHFALCGFSRGPDVPDAREIIASAIAPITHAADLLPAVRRAFQQKLWPSLAAASKFPMFNTLFHGPLIEILISDGRTLVGFGAERVPGEPFAARMFGGPLGDDGELFFYSSGQTFARDLVMTEPRPAWLQRGDTAAARRVIDMQAARTPDRVGGPVDVVELYSAEVCA